MRIFARNCVKLVRINFAQLVSIYCTWGDLNASQELILLTALMNTPSGSRFLIIRYNNIKQSCLSYITNKIKTWYKMHC